MRVGPLHLTWRTQPQKQELIAYLRGDMDVRELVARLARSEVKNYLAEIAERDEVPFVSPEEKHLVRGEN